MRRIVCGAALVALSGVSVFAQSIAITGGKVYPVSGPVLERGTVLIRDGRIVAVGADVAVPADAQRIDASGKVVTPGLMNASTQLGLVEIGAIESTRETRSRRGDGVAAAFMPWEGLNTTSILIGPARDAGITSAAILPSGGLISGQVGVIHLVGGTMTDMILRAPVAMQAALG